MRSSLALVMIAACSQGPRGAAALTVHDDADGAPIAGEIVLAHDPDGALISRTTTDAQGNATIVVEQGGSLTVIGAGGGASTIADVAPGDLFGFGRPEPSALGEMHVMLPADPQATSYDVDGPGYVSDLVLYTGPTVRTWLDAPPATGDVLAIAGGTGDTLIAPAQAIVPGGTLDLTGYTWSPTPTARVAVTGLPADASTVVLTRVPMQGGVSFFGGFGGTPTPIANGGATIAFACPNVGDGARDDLTIDLPRTDGLTDDYLTIGEPGASTTLDVSAQLLPRWKAPVAFDGHTISWSLADGGTVAPVAARLSVESWSVVVPGDWRSFTLPDLPADLARSPSAGSAGGTLVGTGADSYPTYRAHAFLVRRYLGRGGDPFPDAPFELLDAPRPPATGIRTSE